MIEGWNRKVLLKDEGLENGEFLIHQPPKRTRTKSDKIHAFLRVKANVFQFIYLLFIVTGFSHLHAPPAFPVSKTFLAEGDRFEIQWRFNVPLALFCSDVGEISARDLRL